MLNSDKAGSFLLEDSGVYVLKLDIQISIHGALFYLNFKNLRNLTL